MSIRSGQLLWGLIGLFVLGCGPALAADAPTSNATLAELRLWFAIMVIAAIGLAGIFWRSGKGLFGLLAAAILLGGSARLWLTQPLWFPRLEISADPPENLIMLAILAAQAVLTGLVLLRPAGRAAVRGLVSEAGLVRLFILMVLVAIFSLSATPYVAYGYHVAYGL